MITTIQDFSFSDTIEHMNFIGFMVIAILLYPSICFANLANLQKFRLAKAKVALENEDHQTYKKLIQKNIVTSVPHIDSLIHWGDYLFEQQKYSKAFRAYHQVIGRLHSKKLLEEKDNTKLKTVIRDIAKPEEKIKQLYLKLADYYLILLKNKTFNHLHKDRFRLKAEKYLLITKHYNYQKFYATFHLGKLKLAEGKKEEAYIILEEAQQIPSERKDQKEMRDEIDLIMAESLFHYQKRDSSQIYLRGIYQNHKTNSSSRDYAKHYFDSLEKDYFGSTISYLITQKYNLHELTTTERENVETESFKQEYGVENGVLHTLNFQSYLNKKLKNRWSVLGNINYASENPAQEKAKRAETRYFSFGLDLKKYTQANSLYKINYSYSVLWSKPAKDLSLTNNDADQTIRPEYTYIKKSGAITWGGIYSVIKEDTDTKTALGLSWSFQSHNRSTKWSPTYSVELLKQSEILEQPSSTIINLSLSNPSLLNENWTLYSAIDFTKNSNAQTNLDFSRYELALAAQREMEFLKNFYFDLSLRQSNKSRGDGESISIFELGAGCTYNF